MKAVTSLESWRKWHMTSLSLVFPILSRLMIMTSKLRQRSTSRSILNTHPKGATELKISMMMMHVTNAWIILLISRDAPEATFLQKCDLKLFFTFHYRVSKQVTGILKFLDPKNPQMWLQFYDFLLSHFLWHYWNEFWFDISYIQGVQTSLIFGKKKSLKWDLHCLGRK